MHSIYILINSHVWTRRLEKENSNYFGRRMFHNFSVQYENAVLQVSPFYHVSFLFCFFHGRFMHVMLFNMKKGSQQHQDSFSALFDFPLPLPALTIPPRQINCNAKIGKGKYRSELFHAAAVDERAKYMKALNIHNLYVFQRIIWYCKMFWSLKVISDWE